MSFLGDVFGFVGNIVSAPINFARNATSKIPVVGAVTNFYSGGFKSAADILKGENVAQSLVKGNVLDPVLSTAKIQNQLTLGYNKDIFNKVGLSGITQLYSAADSYYNDPNKNYKDNLLKTARGGATIGALVGAALTGGAAAPTLGVSSTTAAIGATYATNKILQGNNVLDSLSGYASGFIPGEYKDTYETIKGYGSSVLSNAGYSGNNYGTPLNPGGNIVQEVATKKNDQLVLLGIAILAVSVIAYRRLK